MNSAEILVGHIYSAMVNRKLEKVRVDRIRQTITLGRGVIPSKTRYECSVFFSGGRVELLKADRFREEITV